MKKVAISVFCFLGLCVGVGQCGQIGLGAFSGHENLITFTPGFTTVDNFVASPVTYQSVTLTSVGTGGSLNDFGIKNNSNESGWFANIPGSSQGNLALDNVRRSDIYFDFSTPVNRAGLLLATAISDTWTVKAYDPGLNILGSFQVSSSGPHSVFAGFESTSLIRRLEVLETADNGLATAFDDIRFEAVPEPSTFALSMLAFVSLLLFRRFGSKAS